jgi:hypothetical protein
VAFGGHHGTKFKDIEHSDIHHNDTWHIDIQQNKK